MLRDGPCTSGGRVTEVERAARQRAIRRILWVILFANVAVATVKYLYGSYTGLVSVRADGVHSYTDGSSNLIGLLALRLAMAPPDKDHPYGHRKIEVAASLGIGVMILFGMYNIAMAAIDAARSGARPSFGPEGFAIAGGTLAINLLVAAIEARAGKRLNSLILTADAHHTLSDSLATVAVLIGMVAISWGYYRADLIATVVVIVLIITAALGIFRAGVSTLLDNVQIDPGRIRLAALRVPGVEACHAVRSRGQPDFVFVDLHILVNPDMTVREGHRLSHEVTRQLLDEFHEIADVLVHIEPWDDTDLPPYEHDGGGADAKAGDSEGGPR